MNSHQQQALWSHALRELADTINEGQAPAPSSMVLYSQWVTPPALLAIADNSTPEPLQINDRGQFVDVTVPVGRPLDLDITWVSMVHVDGLATPEDQADFRKAVRAHNTYCVGAPAAGPDDDVPDPHVGETYPSILDDATRTGAAPATAASE